MKPKNIDRIRKWSTIEVGDILERGGKPGNPYGGGRYLVLNVTHLSSIMWSIEMLYLVYNQKGTLKIDPTTPLISTFDGNNKRAQWRLVLKGDE